MGKQAAVTFDIFVNSDSTVEQPIPDVISTSSRVGADYIKFYLIDKTYNTKTTDIFTKIIY